MNHLIKGNMFLTKMFSLMTIQDAIVSVVSPISSVVMFLQEREMSAKRFRQEKEEKVVFFLSHFCSARLVYGECLT